MSGNEISFGSKPRMKEVTPGTEAIFRFLGKGKMVETEYGEKISFPISLISHDSYPQLEDGPMEMTWESKCQAAKQLYVEMHSFKIDHPNKSKTKFHKELKEAYENSKWQLTRFDTGAYFITVIK